jgi:hypothetical protein
MTRNIRTDEKSTSEWMKMRVLGGTGQVGDMHDSDCSTATERTDPREAAEEDSAPNPTNSIVMLIRPFDRWAWAISLRASQLRGPACSLTSNSARRLQEVTFFRSLASSTRQYTMDTYGL